MEDLNTLMHKKREEFGAFLKSKRTDKGYALSVFSKELGFSASYITDIEKGNRNPLRETKLQEIIRLLNLNEKEAETLYDLASKCKNCLPEDIYTYMQQNDMILKVLIEAKNHNLSNEDWQKIYDEIEKE